MIATSGFLSALECTKFVYSAPPDSLAGLRGPTSKGREKGKGKKERGGSGPISQIPRAALGRER